MSIGDDQIDLPATYIGAQPPSGVDQFGGGFDVSGNGFNSGAWGSGGVDPSRYADVGEVYDSERIIIGLQQNAASAIQQANDPAQRDYEEKLAAMPAALDQQVAAVRAETGAASSSSIEEVNQNISARSTLIERKTIELQAQVVTANAYYGTNPIGRTAEDYVNEGYRRVALDGVGRLKLLQDMEVSYKAAYVAKLLEAEIQSLNSQVANLKAALTDMQAQEQARIAAEVEAQRVADEAAAKAAADQAAADAAAKAAADQAAADAAKVAADAAAEQARIAAETIRVANTFRAPGSASAAGPVFMTSAGTVAVVEAAGVTIAAAIRAAIAALVGGVVGTLSAAAVGVIAFFSFPQKLANGELPEHYAFSTPLTDLAPNHGQDLNAIAAAGGSIDVPYRVSSKTAADGQSEVFVVKTDGVTVPSKVRVVAATYDATQKIYAATTADVPPRTLTWIPIVNPGNSSTTSPAEQPAPPVYTGATVTPVEGRIDTFPEVGEASFDDYILILPGTDIPPLYVMFRDRREDAGVATGVGQPVSGIWLGAATQGEGAPIPSQIADQLRGKEFKNFRAFREAFWKAVANDSELVKNFNKFNVAGMHDGLSPFPPKTEQVGGREKYEIHHVIGVGQDGAVYDVDNLRITTPKLHINIHSNKGA